MPLPALFFETNRHEAAAKPEGEDLISLRRTKGGKYLRTAAFA